MNILNIKAVDIPDSWFQAIYNLDEKGRKYVVQHGSFVGQTRIEFDFAVIEIAKPYAEPYDSMLPKIPAHFNIPNPVCEGYVEQYMPYLMTPLIKDGEVYTYGSRLTNYDNSCNPYCNMDYKEASQIAMMIELLKNTPNTNQAILQIAKPEDCKLDDPPCCRSIHMKIIDNKLIAYPYFRSNDLWGGYPANLAGIAVLQKYMADEIGVESGSMVYSSSGLHIYGYVEEIVKLRTGKN